MFSGLYAKYGKRALDIVLSILGMMILLVPFVISLAYQKSQKRDLYVSQVRYGTNKEIVIYKLKTIFNKEGSDPSSDDKDDLETTPFTRIVRWFGLDEYPQLFLVLKGEMSLVGPRPFPPDLANEQLRFGAYRSTPKGLISPAAAERRFRMPEATMIEVFYCLAKPTLKEDAKVVLSAIQLLLGRSGEGIRRQDEFILSRPRDTSNIPGFKGRNK